MSIMGAAILALLGNLSLQDSRLDPRPLQPFFQKYCSDCHLDGTAKGGLDLAALATDLQDAEALRRWIRVYDRVRAGEMPPPRKLHSSPQEQETFLSALGSSLTRADR